MAGAHPPLSSGYQSISSKFAFWGCQPLRSLSKRVTGAGIQTAARTLLFLLTLAACQFGVAQVTVSGVVRDSSGAAVIGAEVALRAGPTSATVKTGPEGRFSFSGVAESSGVIRVTAPGFASAEQAWSATAAIIELELTLQPPSGSERITVSATGAEMKLSEVPGVSAQL